jgi:hypothetical protein
VVGLDGEGAEVEVRRRQELTGDEGNDGDRAPVTDWHRGGVVELRRGAVKLPRWSSGAMGGSRWELCHDQGLASEEEGGGGGVRGSGRVKSKRGSGMGREGASEALELKKRRRGGAHGHCHYGGEVSFGGSSGRRGEGHGKRAGGQKRGG